jgi:serine/threonine protein kinase
MRLNCHVGHEKLRISIDEIATLATLSEEIVRRWARTHDGEKMSLAELRTIDNVLLDKMDRVGDVLRDDETLVCVTGRSQTEECRVGDMILHYYLTSLLGEGTYGMVFKAHDLNLNRYVAVKVLRIKKANDVNVRRFLREAEINASLSTDPHIVTVHDFGRTAHGRFYLVMEMLEGLALNDVLDERIASKTGFTPLEVIDVIMPVLRGLVTAHKHVPRIVHRDLKPDNIWINKSALDRNLLAHQYDSPFSSSPQNNQPTADEEALTPTVMIRIKNPAASSTGTTSTSTSSPAPTSTFTTTIVKNSSVPLKRFGPYAAKIMDFGIAV